MTFPDQPFETAEHFVDAYAERVSAALASIDRARVAAAAKLLAEAYSSESILYSCGNGGSAAISNHLHCDHLKGVQTDTAFRPRIVSLVSVMETITAIANDISYDEVFVYQLRTMARPGDVLITISSSGDSENIVRAIQWAKDNGVATIALTGFNGGRASAIADIHIHVDSDNYGVVEDVHQSVMHMLAQYIRMSDMTADLIANKKF